MPPAARSSTARGEEAQAIIGAIASHLTSRGLPRVLPKLPYLQRTEQLAMWADGTGNAIRDAVLAEINRVRAKQRAGGIKVKDLGADGAVKEINRLAGAAANFENADYFAELAAQYKVPLMPQRKSARSSGLPTPVSLPSLSPASSEPTPEPVPEPAATRTAATAAAAAIEDEQAAAAAVALLDALSPHARELVGKALPAPTVAALIAGQQRAAGGLQLVAEQLSLEQRQQLAPPPPPRVETASQASDAEADVQSAAERAHEAVAAMADGELLTLLDRVGKLVFKGDARRGACLRRCVVAMRRIADYQDEDGIEQRDFLRSILECYGAEGEERLPFCSVLTWLLYYAHRSVDNDNYGFSVTTLHFDADGGMYLDAWTDIMDHAGHVAINLLRGYMFSGMVKSGKASRGRLSLRDWTLRMKKERLFFGTAVPSVQALNARVKPEEKVDRGGMSKPIERAMAAFKDHVQSGASKLVGRELAPISGNEMRKTDAEAAARSFRHDLVHADLHGEHVACPVLPTKPKPSDAGKWWTRSLEEATAELAARNAATAAAAAERATAEALAAAEEAATAMDVDGTTEAAPAAGRAATEALAAAPAAATQAPAAAVVEAPAAATAESDIALLEASRRLREEVAAQQPSLDEEMQLREEVRELCTRDSRVQEYYDLWYNIEQEDRFGIFLSDADRMQHIRRRTERWTALKAQLEPELARKVERAAKAFWRRVPGMRDRM